MRIGSTVLLIGLSLLSAGGCASNGGGTRSEKSGHGSPSRQSQPNAGGGAALVFTPPVVLHDPIAPADLSREGREVTAYVGYEDRVDYLYVRQDDRIGDNDWYNPTRFQRRAISTTTARRVR
jgi:hypothetical protein